MSRALVTGANGHLGANLVRKLLAEGHNVRALVREKGDRRGLAGLPVEIVLGDVLEPASIPPAVDGCELVFHAAAVYATWAKDPSEIVRPSVEGTRNVLGAAAKAGVKRVVFTSSVAAVGASPDPQRILDEKSWNDDRRNAYYEAKTLGEREAWAMAKELKLDVIAVNPGLIVGPHDWRTTPSMGVVRNLMTGEMPIFAGGYSVIAVGDVADLHVLAASKGVAGERYLASGANVSVADLAAALRRLTGHGSTRAYPAWLMFLAADVSGLVARVTGGKPAVQRDTLDEAVGKFAWYDNSKARTALGWSPLGLDDALTLAIRWLVFRKDLPEPIVDGLREKFAADPSFTN